MVPVAEAGGAVGSDARLALPVDERAADGVVAVARGGGEAAAGLVEREGEQLGVGVLGFVDAALLGRDLGAGADAEGGEDLDAGVAAVHLEGHVGVRGERGVEVVDLRVERVPITRCTTRLRLERSRVTDVPRAGANGRLSWSNRARSSPRTAGVRSASRRLRSRARARTRTGLDEGARRA